MKHERARFETILRRGGILPALILGLAIAAASPVLGQATRLELVGDPERNAAARRDLIVIVSRLQELTAAPERRAELAELERRFEEMPDREFESVSVPLGRMLSELRVRVERVHEGSRGTGRPAPSDVREDLDRRGRDDLAPRTTSPAFPAAPYPAVQAFDTSQDTEAEIDQGASPDRSFSGAYSVSCNRSARLSFQTRFDLKAGLLIAEAIRDVAGRLCDQSFFIAGVGTDFSLVCIITDAIYHVARTFEEFPALCDAIINAAEIEGSYDRLGYLHGQLTDHESALSAHATRIANKIEATKTQVLSTVAQAETNLSNAVSTHDIEMKADLALHDTEIRAAVTAHDAEIKALLAADEAFFLRTAIERALQRQRRLASVYLPEVFGGQASTVRGTVVQALAGVAASGESTHDATQRLAQGDAAFAAGQYKRAWSHYSAAYFATVKLIGE